MPPKRFTSKDYSDQHAAVFEARYDDGKRATKRSAFLRFAGDLRGRRVLDIGCGIGFFASLCTDLGAQVVACDFAESMVKRSSQRYGSKFLTIRSDVGALPVASGEYDMAIGLDVIEHLYEPGRMLREMRRILKLGGRLILTTDRPGFQIGTLPVFVIRRFVTALRLIGIRLHTDRPDPRYSTPLCTHICEFPIEKVIELVSRAGFHLRRLDTYPLRSHYGFFGTLVEFLCRGWLRRYKWDYAIYEFIST